MRTKYIIICFVLLIPNFVFSQTRTFERSLNWAGSQTIQLNEMEEYTILKFQGSINEYINEYLPYYFERIPLSDNSNMLDLQIVNKIFEPVNSEDLDKINGLNKIGNEISIKFHKSYDRKKPMVTLSFIPLRINDITGLIERLVSFNIEITETVNDLNLELKSSTNYSDNSVLAQGEWIKIAVTNTGIHKITYQELSNMGFDVGSIDPRNLRIYGNGGGMLLEDPTKFRHDDLAENAILVVGENDGVFDPADYVLFYGESPNEWKYTTTKKKIYQQPHLYSDFTYYFITISQNAGKRIAIQESPSGEPTHFINSFDFAIHHEIEETNLIKSGRIWYGETFDIYTSKEFDFTIPNLKLDDKVFFMTDVAARSDAFSSFTFYANNSSLFNIGVSASNSSYQNSDYAKTKWDSTFFYSNGENIKIKVVYNKSLSSSVGWLNYFTMNMKRKLTFTGGQLPFRDLSTSGQLMISEYTVSKTPDNTVVWNVTDPVNIKKMDVEDGNDKLSFTVESETLQEFIAFDFSQFYTVEVIGVVENQNLHGLPICDMIIVTHPAFKEEADRLANFHQSFDDLDVVVVETPVIYNEFSSGSQDITGIRDFVKMFYDKADEGNEPRYLLLFGDGSFDNKNRTDNNTNYIPTWESVQSLNPISSVVKDDFYGLLDDSPNDNLVDIGIGRFVVSSVSQAKSAVDKVIHYSENTETVMGDWRNIICLIADDEDSNLHFFDAEELATMIDTTDKNINIDKIYMDAYQQISSPSGQKYPEVTQALNNRVDRGALIINYVGHGGELGLAHERILQIADINSWDNYENLPVFMTATCEFSRFDDPERTSAGEQVFLHSSGGGIALFTTVRATYAGDNSALNKNFYKYLLKETDGEHCRMGDVLRLAKNSTGGVENKSKFILMGDPALKFAFPEHDVTTAQINDIAISDHIDTIRALSQVKISGEMINYQDEKLSDFNGTIYPTVYDKPSKYTTLGNDPGSSQKAFDLQKNILYKGKASVHNGEWSFTFLAPKDIAYNYGFGKISYYAMGDDIDASGYFDELVIGGYDNQADIDSKGPEVNLFMNDESFVFGGLTDQNPKLVAFISDQSGINTVGSGIGHDILATLEDGSTHVLNDFYQSDLDSYQSGKISYPLYNLSNGRHQVTLKIWDIYNNSTTAYTEFVVASSSEMAINSLMNFPNPFNSSTTFSFEHNQAEEPLDITIQIYNLSGQLIKTINDFYNAGGYRYQSEEWGGTNDGGNKLNTGIYIYSIFVKNHDGSLTEETEKLVIIK